MMAMADYLKLAVMVEFTSCRRREISNVFGLPLEYFALH